MQQVGELGGKERGCIGCKRRGSRDGKRCKGCRRNGGVGRVKDAGGVAVGGVAKGSWWSRIQRGV